MSSFYMMIGPAGCGKTHLARLWSAATGSVVISSDDIREELFGDASIQKNHAKVFDLAHDRIIETLDEGCDVVFDATNLVPKHRKDCLELVRGHSNCNYAIVYTGKLSKCLEQNKMRDRQVPEGVIENMYMTLHRYGYFPSLEEGFDMMTSMEYLAESLSLAKIGLVQEGE